MNSHTWRVRTTTYLTIPAGLQELRNDVAADDVGSDDGEVCVSGHEVLYCVCDSRDRVVVLCLFPFIPSLGDHHGHPSRLHYGGVHLGENCQLMTEEADALMNPYLLLRCY